MAELRYTLNNTTEGELILERDPDGWENIDIKLQRDKDNHGINEVFSFDLSFHCSGGGKEYLDNIYETQGINAEVTILIEYKCNDTFDTIFDGKINYLRYESDKLYTVVNIESNDFWSIIKARYDTKIDLSSTTTLDGDIVSTIDVGIDTMTLHNRSTSHKIVQSTTSFSLGKYRSDASAVPGSYQYSARTPIFIEQSIDTLGTALLPVSNGNTNPASGDTNYIKSLRVAATPVDPISTLYYGADPIFKATVTSDTTSTYHIQFDIDIDVNRTKISGLPGTMIYHVWLRTFVKSSYDNLVKARMIDEILLGTSSSLVALSQNYTQSINAYYAMNKGEYFFATIDIESSVIDGSTFVVDHEIYCNSADFQMDLIDEDTGGKSSSANRMLLHSAFKRILQSITNEEEPMRSEFFGLKSTVTGNGAYTAAGCGGFNALSYGYGIRNYPIADYPFAISLKDLFDGGIKQMFCLGIGMLDDIVRIERIEFFYDDTIIHTFDYLTDIKKAIISDMFYSSLDVGYSKWKVEDFNGSSEFNTKSYFAIPANKKIENKLNLVSNIVAGGVPIEYTRRKQYDDATLEDSDFDNDYFIIALNRTVDGGGTATTLGIAEKDENYSVVSGIYEEDKAYNIRHTPQKIRIRNNPLIGSGLTKESTPNTFVNYQSSDANMDISVTAVDSGCSEDKDGQSVNETSSLSVIDSGIDETPLFIPEFVEFEAPISYSEFQYILSNRYGCFAYSRTNTGHEHGFIYDMTFNLKSGMTKFKLLRKYE